MSRIVTQLALAYPEIGFTLTSAGRKVLQCPPAASLRDRLYQLYGERADLIEVHKEAGGITLTGFIAALAEQGPTRGPQNVFINRRIVKDRTIAHAIIDSYSRRRSRSAARRCTCSSRCRRTRSTSTCTRPRRRCGSASSRSCTKSSAARLMDALGARRRAAAAAAARARCRADAVRGGAPGRARRAGHIRTAGSRTDQKAPQGSQSSQQSVCDRTKPGLRDLCGLGGFRHVAVRDIKPMIPLGQFRDTFIIAVDDEGIAIIDQHVAHERVLFERVMERLTARPARVAAAAACRW